MKKLKMLIIALVLMVMPIVANADFGMPEVNSYEATVSNAEGAAIYKNEDGNYVKTDKTLPYDTKIKVSYEFDAREGLMASTYDDEDNDIYIYVKDLRPVKGKVDTYKLETAVEYATYKDVNMYEYPSKSYDVVATIPKGTTIKLVEAVDEVWFKYTFEGKTGYVYVQTIVDLYNETSGLALRLEKKEDIITFVNIKKAFSEPMLGGNAIIKGDIKDTRIDVDIPAFTKFEVNYKYQQRWNDYYLVNYKGTEMWLSASDLGIKDESIIIPYKDITLYRNFNDKYSTSDRKLSSYVKYSVLYRNANDLDDEWYLIDLNYKTYYFMLVEGSMEYNDNSDCYWFNSVENVTIEKEVDTYSYSKELNTYSKDKTLKPGKYEAYSYNDGYTKSEYIFIKGTLVKGFVKRTDLDSSEVVEEHIKEEKEDIASQINKKKGLALKPMIIAIICVVGAVVIGVTALVTILLIKKSKKKKAVVNTSAPVTPVNETQVNETQVNEVTSTPVNTPVEEEKTEEKVVDTSYLENQPTEVISTVNTQVEEASTNSVADKYN